MMLPRLQRLFSRHRSRNLDMLSTVFLNLVIRQSIMDMTIVMTTVIITIINVC